MIFSFCFLCLSLILSRLEVIKSCCRRQRKEPKVLFINRQPETLSPPEGAFSLLIVRSERSFSAAVSEVCPLAWNLIKLFGFSVSLSLSESEKRFCRDFYTFPSIAAHVWNFKQSNTMQNFNSSRGKNKINLRRLLAPWFVLIETPDAMLRCEKLHTCAPLWNVHFNLARPTTRRVYHFLCINIEQHYGLGKSKSVEAAASNLLFISDSLHSETSGMSWNLLSKCECW